MRKEPVLEKRTLHGYIIIAVTVIIFLTVGLLMLKYQVEGEKNMPFNLSEMDIISTAKSSEIKKNKKGKWEAEIYQKNDIYFYIEKNDNYKKEEVIKTVKFNNFKTVKTNEIGEVAVYRPESGKEGYEYIYGYKKDYLASGEIIYAGREDTDVSLLEINNQGGIIGFSIITKNIGKYAFKENEAVNVDGRLLNKAKIVQEDIEIKASFDIIIETVSGKVFKSNIEVNLPEGDIIKEGVTMTKHTNSSEFIFKRI